MGLPTNLKEITQRAQQACALVDMGIKPDDVVITFGPAFIFGVINCVWHKDTPKTKTYAYYYHPDCCTGLVKDGGLPKLCIQTVLGEEFPFLTTPNEWYEIILPEDGKPFARRIVE